MIPTGTSSRYGVWLRIARRLARVFRLGRDRFARRPRLDTTLRRVMSSPAATCPRHMLQCVCTFRGRRCPLCLSGCRCLSGWRCPSRCGCLSGSLVSIRVHWRPLSCVYLPARRPVASLQIRLPCTAPGSVAASLVSEKCPEPTLPPRVEPVAGALCGVQARLSSTFEPACVRREA